MGLIFTALAFLAFQNPPPIKTIDTPNNTGKEQVILTRLRADNPIRLGGVFTLGLGDKSSVFEESAALGIPLGEQNQQWLARNTDVVALDAGNVAPEMFPAMTKINPLLTPLLFLYASTLYEGSHRGNVGGWQPHMKQWMLRKPNEDEVPHPDAGAHWMDFGSKEWARHFREQALSLVRKYGAQGVVAAELPIGNTFVEEPFEKYQKSSARAVATLDWLQAARAERQFFMVPSSLGFDSLSPVNTPAPPAGNERPDLAGRLWDLYAPYTDGAWAEGWLYPYWSNQPLPEKQWEMQLQAADRIARGGQIFIAAYSYTTDADLEFGLASYLLVSHKQGQFVFQPMPVLPYVRRDAGYSLTLLKQIVAAKSSYFNAPLGPAMQERHEIRANVPLDEVQASGRTSASGTFVWRRAFYNGVVYVNSHETGAAEIDLGGAMKRCNGEIVRRVRLEPRHAVILTFLSDKEKAALPRGE